jgi:hypothetical protein
MYINLGFSRLLKHINQVVGSKDNRMISVILKLI